MSPTDIREGERYRVLAAPKSADNDRVPPAGAIVVSQRGGVDYEGDACLHLEDHDGRAYWCLPEYLEPLDAPPSPTPIGSTTLRVDVRFFVGDVDVTDRVVAGGFLEGA